MLTLLTNSKKVCSNDTYHCVAPCCPGMNVVGWQILTQLLAETNPSLVTAHVPRYCELRNSYQNRPAIGLAILWSVGQAGAKSLHSGIKGEFHSFLLSLSKNQ